MRIVSGWRWMAMAVLLVVAAGEARAGTSGLVLRAVGWYKGEENISSNNIRCQVPSNDNAIADGLYTMGLWNTFGQQTLQFPDRNSAFANPCGGWIQLWNSMTQQGITLNRIDLRYRIGGAKRFSALVPQKRNFPTECKTFRKASLYAGIRLAPNQPQVPPNSSSGLPNEAFLQVLPMVSSSLFTCLREQYAPLSTDVFVDLPLIIKARVHGIADNGNKYQSNVVKYTLNLRHTCGNQSVDLGEDCDASATGTQCSSGAICVAGVCAADPTRACNVDADCLGTCQPAGNAEECLCVY